MSRVWVAWTLRRRRSRGVGLVVGDALASSRAAFAFAPLTCDRTAAVALAWRSPTAAPAASRSRVFRPKWPHTVGTFSE